MTTLTFWPMGLHPVGVLDLSGIVRRYRDVVVKANEEPVRYGRPRTCETCGATYFAKNCRSRWCPTCRPTEAPKAAKANRTRWLRKQARQANGKTDTQDRKIA